MTLDENVIKEINARIEPFGQDGRDYREGGRSATVNEALSRYFTAIRHTRAKLNAMFTPAEQMLMADICNGALWLDAQTIGYLHMQIDDGIRLNPGIREKWGIPPGLDLPAMIERLTFFEKATIIDAIEMYWAIDEELRPAVILFP
jgi:hypothetical protein